MRSPKHSSEKGEGVCSPFPSKPWSSGKGYVTSFPYCYCLERGLFHYWFYLLDYVFGLTVRPKTICVFAEHTRPSSWVLLMSLYSQKKRLPVFLSIATHWLRAFLHFLSVEGNLDRSWEIAQSGITESGSASLQKGNEIATSIVLNLLFFNLIENIKVRQDFM